MEMSSIENGVEIIKKDFLSFIPQNILDTALEYSWSIFLALLIFFVGKWIVNRVVKVLGKLLRKIDGIDEILVKFLENIAYYSLITAVILAALNKLGITTTSFLAILGAAGLAVGLALKDSLGNFASGVMIIIFKPFRVGDFVTAGGVTGSVSEVGIFNSVFVTGDNQRIVVPNSSITSGSITNVNAFDTRRVDLVVGISYDDDIKKAKDLLTNLLTSHEKILVDKGITVAVSELADSSVNFVVRAWVNTPDYWEVRFFLIENIKLIFDKEGITIPYPQQDVHHYKKD
ncbi:mechanosensitive ion channel family protein [Aliarcobacter skirrowii]|uniref:Mechanosensitive ion channel protein MscS n=1 Tax=Aliarcobacter skirrowii TaxID=28200 RepID=A0A2U2C2N4_9BACT|nr:mechanosensitive ion channel domain-containing protein [Aliarcobacter skirrowii]PWE22830.1 mechanosensitive ion channel protein MscS [Aliarcobacter skirrowii]PWE23294.1 mechanosensitive ion channel protein MscS [Aliarcobacter skirrowii]PWE24907.1 mechanosensitive ion channel protein MscS [Aliarcobacter skirrowii]RJO56521.1 mechanosensitive ion channel family protein [Aliarcobacter skirrowii]RJO58475.1 mechanosensitive ion channel family protein [Aliarcobacter skirrowii]